MTFVPAFSDPDDPISRAIAGIADPLTRQEREARTWGRHLDEEWWGPAGDAGGDPLVIEGDAAILAGRRIPVRVEHGIAYIGPRDRFGRCGECSLLACEYLLDHHPEATPIYAIGRAFGVHQQWAEVKLAGRWYVFDWMLTDEPWERAEYYAALHATVGTRLLIPDRAAVDALRHIDALGSRAQVLERLAPFGIRQIDKE